MKNRNIYGKKEFVMENISWAVIAWIWYKNFLFRCLDSFTFRESKFILLGCVVLTFLIGFWLEMKRHRNFSSTMCNVFIGYGLYTVLIYLKIRKSFILFSLSAAFVLSVLYAFLVFCRKIPRKEKCLLILRRRSRLAAFTAFRLFGIGFMCILGSFLFHFIWGTTLMDAQKSFFTKTNTPEQTIENNRETLCLLRDEAWETLSVQEKLNVLQKVADIERRYLGLPNELNVGTASLDDTLAAYYSDISHQIVINLDYLLEYSSYDLIDTVCHEAYHSYQHRMVDLLNDTSENLKGLRLLKPASCYAREFAEYVSGESDFCDYYSQECESDARSYATASAMEYYDFIYACDESNQ